MKREIKSIPLSLLLIHHENPRFPVAENQREAIIIMIEKQQNKLFNLAQDIAKNGLNPSELIIVTPSTKNKGRFRVLEGNRRITALKLLTNITSIPDKHENLRRKFKPISTDFEKNPITEVNCIVYDDETEAYKWIENRHTGENKGRGIVSWSAYQTARFGQRFGGKSSYALQVLDYLKADDGFDPTLKDKLEDDIAFTSLDRLLEDPDFRNHIGLDMVNKRIQSKYPKEEIRKPFTKVISDISEPSFNVRKIYHKEDRKVYYTKFEKNDLPAKTKKMPPWDLGTKETYIETKQEGKRSLPPSTARTTLIPTSCKLHIDQKRINDIYHELRKLKVGTFVNSVAITFRVFLELSVDNYIERNSLPIHDNDSLSNKIDKVATDLKNKQLLTPGELKPLNVAKSKPHDILSSNTLNAYVHNENIHPSESDLKKTWDNIEPFIRKIWETE